MFKNKFKSFFYNTLLTLVSALFAFIAAEFIYRSVSETMGKIYVDEAHVPRPYVFAATDPTMENINSLGYKGELPPMPKPDDEFRIVVLGGSTVFGLRPWEIKEKALPEILEEYLRNKFEKNIRVYNFGIFSTVSKQEVIRLITDVVEYSPDLVISYGGGNDFYNVDGRVGYPHRFKMYESNPFWKTGISAYPTFHLFAYGSKILRKVFYSHFESTFLNKNENITFKDSNLYSYQGDVQNYLTSLGKMKKIADSYNFKFIAVFQPLRNLIIDEDNDLHLKEWKSFLDKEISKNNFDFELIDFGKVLKGYPKEIWSDVVHLNLEGNELVAKFLGEKLGHFFNK